MAENYLIVQLGRYGDCLYATTIANQIKTDNPDNKIYWVISSQYQSILINNPQIDEVISIKTPNNDIHGDGWNLAEEKAKTLKLEGKIDKIIYSQIYPRNWSKFKGTIRNTILSAYKKKIEVSRRPILNLTNEEINRVEQFAENCKLKKYEKVVLFECSPGSQQSTVNPELALHLAHEIIIQNPNIAFIISSPNRITTKSNQILDASQLTFRENAHLSHYCDLLIGCSSGITWLTTSTAGKILPMIQLIDGTNTFAGVKYDLELNKIEHQGILEMTSFNYLKIFNCIQDYLKAGSIKSLENYHQNYRPKYSDMTNIIIEMRRFRIDKKEILSFIDDYLLTNKHISKENFFKIQLLKTKIELEFLRTKIKHKLWQKQHS